MNTIGTDLKLSNGAITSSILQAAGYGIQDEIKKFRNKQHNNILETKGYNLNCHRVYHTICPENLNTIPYDKVFRGIGRPLLN